MSHRSLEPTYLTEDQLKRQRQDQDQRYRDTMTVYSKGKKVYTWTVHRLEGAAPANIPMKMIEALGLRDFTEHSRQYVLEWGCISSKEDLESAMRLGLLSGKLIYARVVEK